MPNARPLPGPPNRPPAIAEARERADALLAQAVHAGALPGGVVMVADADGTGEAYAHGRERSEGADVTPHTRFDLASLTKVLATLVSVLRLHHQGRLDLDAPLGETFPNAGWFQTPSLAERTPRDLLSHTSGLPAWKPFMGLASERRTVIGHALASELPHPHGSVVYSDLGFIVLGALVEAVSGVRQDRFFAEQVLPAFGLSASELGYRPHGAADPPAAEVPVAATERCGWRGRTLQGEVHDEAAGIMDGVAGHAGLFGTAQAVATVARAWAQSDPAAAPPELQALATRRATAPGQPARGLAWVLAADGQEGPAAADASEVRGPRGFGHSGFTGTSVWIDPQLPRACVLLTNRVHPSRLGGSAERIAGLRRELHRHVFGANANGGNTA